MENNSVIFIRDKPVMNYVLAVVTQFNKGFSSVTLKARGRSISRALDAAEIARNRFMSDLQVKGISTGTVTIPVEQRRTTNVSSIKICADR